MLFSEDEDVELEDEDQESTEADRELFDRAGEFLVAIARADPAGVVANGFSQVLDACCKLFNSYVFSTFAWLDLVF